MRRPDDSSETEQVVWQAYGTGTRVDIRDRADRTVRAELLRYLLLGGVPGEPGALPALRVTGARVVGSLYLAYADIQAAISLRDCEFTDKLDLYGAHLRQLSLAGSTLADGLTLSNGTVDGSLNLRECRVTGPVRLVGTRLGGALILNGASLSRPPSEGAALLALRLHVGNDLLAQNGFTCAGEIQLNNAEVGGSLRWEGATLANPGGTALSASDLRVGAVANLCDGFTAEGTIHLAHAQVVSKLCFNGATLTGGTLDCRHLSTRELALRPTKPPERVDLSHARVGQLRDDPDTWAAEVRLDGLAYEALSDSVGRDDRLAWLRRDRRGFRPQAYEQLASAYRVAGRDDDARAVLLAGERHRREALGWAGRLWGRLQDVTVGYGYLPGRAAAWLVGLLVLGTVVFGLVPPIPTEPGAVFVAPVYTVDLIVPVLDLGQQSAFTPSGAAAWLAYLLIASGLVFVTTITAAAARRLRRD